MRLYLDSNIYALIARLDQARVVRDFLDRADHQAEASSEHLVEAGRIPDDILRVQVQAAIVTVSAHYEPKPQSWLHAKEVRAEIERCRPQWLRSRPSRDLVRRANKFLKAHEDNWERVAHFAPVPSYAKSRFEIDLRHGIGMVKEAQKTLKKARSSGSIPWALFSREEGDEVVVDELISDDEEQLWRWNCLETWHNAIARRLPESRDYADWLLPYVRHDAFGDASYSQFWLEDVRAENVPLNRLVSVVSWYQIATKITSGNALDQIHAGHLLSCDRFITADQAFFGVLQQTVKKYYPNAARPVLVDGGTSDILGEFEQALG